MSKVQFFAILGLGAVVIVILVESLATDLNGWVRFLLIATIVRCLQVILKDKVETNT